MSAPRRILMTVDAVGGVWTYAAELARALAPRGYRTTLAVLGPNAGAAQRAECAGTEEIEIIETGLALDWMARDEAEVRAAGRAVAALAGRVGADLIQLNQPALAAEPMPLPSVAVMHSCVTTWWQAVETGPLPQSFAWQKRLVRAGLRNATRIACPSAAYAEAVRAAYDLPRLPVVVHNGRTLPPRSGGAIGDFAFTAGRLWDRGKNVAVLDRAAARLAVSFKAAGALGGPNGEAIRFEHLQPIGQIDAATLGTFLSARPVFASAARYEPFGLAVLEAAQAGCPLILSDIPTFRELWGDVARFVSPDDAPGFAAAIEALIGDARVRRAQGDLARRAAARFTPAAMATGMAELYRAALDADGARAVA